MDRTELEGWLRLGLTPGVGDRTARKLLAAFGLPETVFAQSPAALRECISERVAQALGQRPEGLDALLERTWQWLQGATADGPARRILTLGDPHYPAALLEMDDPPLLLYALGNAAALDGDHFPRERCLAVVGSRNPTAQGADHARQFAKALRELGYTIVSGLALGVDAAAHEGALEAVAGTDTADPTEAQPATIAIVGTGLDRVYPRQHRDLAHRIAAQGLLLSEYPLGTPPLPANFPKRNRLISGLSQGTLVVEAALASGSLVTARLAAEQGREVFAIPGSIHAPQSRGCHALIRQGAKLVESAQDILEELQGFVPTLATARPKPAARASNSAPTAPASEAAALVPETGDPLLQAMGFDPVGLDALIARTGIDTATLQVRLLEFELDGQVGRLPGGLFQRMGRA